MYASRIGDIEERISVEQHEVGDLAFLEGADILVKAAAATKGFWRFQQPSAQKSSAEPA